MQSPSAGENVVPAAVDNSGTVASVTTPTVTYASLLERFLAGLIDGILFGFLTGILSGMMSLNENYMGNLGFGLLTALAQAYLLSTYGFTVGKKLLKIKVISDETGQKLNFMQAFLREFVGKFVSALVFGIGYLWMIWDPKKQTWHDKIVKSLVVKETM